MFRRSPAALRAAIVFTPMLLALGALSTGHAIADDRRVLTVAVNDQPAKLDPADAPLAVDMRVTYSIFDTLIRRDYKAEQANPTAGAVLLPSLATAWHRIDSRTLELTLRPGVKFHNGDTLTADDVAFTFSQERIFGEKAMIPTARRYLGSIEAVEVVDPLTVRIRTTNPDPILELRLADSSAGIVSKRAYAEEGVDGFKRNPVGTGPAKFVSWKDGDQLEFAAFDDYWGGKPNFSKIVYRVIPDLSGRVACLVNKECDIAIQLSPDQLPTLAAAPDIAVEKAILDNLQVIWFVGTEKYVSDKRIRQALSLAIDRDLLVKSLWGGETQVPTSWQAPSFGALYDTSRHDFAYDPAKAKALLAAAGYDGGEITVRYVAGYYPFGDEMIQAVSKMWQDIGVNAKLQAVESVAQSYEPGRSIGTGSISFLMPAPEGLGYGLFDAGALAEARHGFQIPAGFHELIGKLYGSEDPAERKTLYGQVLDILADEVPATAVYMMPQFYGVAKGVDWQPSSTYSMDFRPDSFSFR